jgi:Flp pilus assembly pilin Flp
MVKHQIKKWLDSEAAVTSIEYGLIGVLIAVLIVGTVTTVGVELEAAYNYIANCITDWSCE